MLLKYHFQVNIVKNVLNENFYFFLNANSFCAREWPSGLRRYIQNRKVPSSNPTSCSAGLWDQPRYEAPGELQV